MIPIIGYIIVLIVVLFWTARRISNRPDGTAEQFYGNIALGMIVITLEFFVITAIFFLLFPRI